MTATITDFSQFTGLRAAAERNDPAALREVANQFEALFLQTMLKNMREASLGEALIGNSDQFDMYQGMMDEQLALEMASGKGVGLADMLVRQLGGEEAAMTPTPGTYFSIPRVETTAKVTPVWSTPEEFARDIWPHARRAAQQLNVAPQRVQLPLPHSSQQSQNKCHWHSLLSQTKALRFPATCFETATLSLSCPQCKPLMVGLLPLPLILPL